MMLGSIPFLVDFFAMTMGVNHRKDKDKQPSDHQNDEHWFILPDFADKFGQLHFHHGLAYTNSVAK